MRFASTFFWYNLKEKIDLLVFVFFAAVANFDLLQSKKVNEGVISDMLLLRAGLFS